MIKQTTPERLVVITKAFQQWNNGTILIFFSFQLKHIFNVHLWFHFEEKRLMDLIKLLRKYYKLVDYIAFVIEESEFC